MREIGKILAYAAAIIALGSLLAPPLYWAGRAVADSGVFPSLARVPFSRYYNRAVLIVALSLLWPFMRWIGVGRWTDLQLESNPRRWRDLFTGLAIAVPALYLVAAGVLLWGNAYFHVPFRWWKVFVALGTAVAVGIIEEIFFRGALLGVLRRSLSWFRAVFFLSLFFGIVHFIKPHPAAKSVADVGWLTGFEILPYSFYQFGNPTLVLVGWVTLVLFGFMLGYATVRTRSLYMSIGLHGGFVFALRSFMLTTWRKGDGSVWVGRDLTVGIIPIVLLLVCLGMLWYILRGRQGSTSAEVARS